MFSSLQSAGRKAWLESLKAGDQVILTGGPHYASLDGGKGRMCHIVRLTKTLFILDHRPEETRIRRADGYMTGAHFYGYHIVEATPERVAVVNAHRYRQAESSSDAAPE